MLKLYTQIEKKHETLNQDDQKKKMTHDECVYSDEMIAATFFYFVGILDVLYSL